MSSLIVLQGRPYHNFINSLKSVETKQAYQKALLRYLSHYKTTLENILTLPVSQIENMLIDYLMDQKTNHNFTGRERKPIPLNHGYRKWWMGQAVSANMNPEIREMLMNHSIGLASVYYKPTSEEILDEYMKAVDNGYFVISEENRLKRKVEKLEVEKSQFDRLAAQIAALEQKIK